MQKTNNSTQAAQDTQKDVVGSPLLSKIFAARKGRGQQKGSETRPQAAYRILVTEKGTQEDLIRYLLPFYDTDVERAKRGGEAGVIENVLKRAKDYTGTVRTRLRENGEAPLPPRAL